MTNAFGLANPGFVAGLAGGLLAEARYRASDLPGASNSAVPTWPNSGTGGSAFDLAAAGTGTPTLVRGTGPTDPDYVSITAGNWLQTAATNPLSGAQDRTMWLVGQLASTTTDQDLLTCGSGSTGRSCGIVNYQGNPRWWNYGYNNSIRGASTALVALLWRGRVEGSTFQVYVQGSDTAIGGNAFPASAANTNAAAPLQVGHGVFFGAATTLKVVEAGVAGSFASNAQVAAFNAYLNATYGLTL